MVVRVWGEVSWLPAAPGPPNLSHRPAILSQPRHSDFSPPSSRARASSRDRGRNGLRAKNNEFWVAEPGGGRRGRGMAVECVCVCLSEIIIMVITSEIRFRLFVYNWIPRQGHLFPWNLDLGPGLLQSVWSDRHVKYKHSSRVSAYCWNMRHQWVYRTRNLLTLPLSASTH